MSQASQPIFHGLQKRWRLVGAIPPEHLAPLGDLPPLVASILYRQGIRTAQQAQEFIGVNTSLLEDPATLPGVAAALDRLGQARRDKELVAVYGDFDADGVTGAVLMERALRRYGIPAIPYIPHRVEEGHGLNPEAIRRLRLAGASLIVTVDCGVTDVAPVALARELGMDTIVTDHHAVSGPLPHAAAVINPRAPHSTYAFDHLTGVGMALKLAQALLEPAHGPAWADGLLELAAIGTVTDMAPLVHENRFIVHHGLGQLRKTQTLGLQALMRLAGLQPSLLQSGSIGFALGPRLNAAGRLDHGMLSYNLLTTTDPATAGELAAQLERHNEQRRALTDQTLLACQEQLASTGGPDSLILVGSAGYNPGVIGLVAGRLAEQFGVPAAVYALDGEIVRASCRGGSEFHWASALAACQELLVRHGGHAQAAGFTCMASSLPVLHEQLLAIAGERPAGAAQVREGRLDAQVELPQIMGATLPKLQQLEPFGIGNPTPVFLTRDVAVQSVQAMGANGQHLRLRLRSGGALWDAVAFRQTWQPGTHRADIVYTVDIDHWGGSPRLRLNLQDYAPA